MKLDQLIFFGTSLVMLSTMLALSNCGREDVPSSKLTATKDVLHKMRCADDRWLIQCKLERFEVSSLNEILENKVCQAPVLNVINQEGTFLASIDESSNSCFLESGETRSIKSATREDWRTGQRLVEFKDVSQDCSLTKAYVYSKDISIEFANNRRVNAQEEYPKPIVFDRPYYSYPSRPSFPSHLVRLCQKGIDYEQSCYKGPWFSPFEDLGANHLNCKGFPSGEFPDSDYRMICVPKEPKLNTQCSMISQERQKVKDPIDSLSTLEKHIDIAHQENPKGLKYDLSVEIDITHSYIGDLRIDLIAPNNEVFNLASRQGGSLRDLKGKFTFNLGSLKEIGGRWTLKVKDAVSSDSGFLNYWSLTFYQKDKPNRKL